MNVMRYQAGLMFGELVETGLGPISFMATPLGVQRIAFAPLSALRGLLTNQDAMPSWEAFDIVKRTVLELNEYFEGERKAFTFAIDWCNLTDFQRRVLQKTSAIPYGKVLTYGAIAQQLDQPQAACAVGRALAANPLPVVVPCHRVIGSDHNLHGYLGGLERKTFLLRLEGHRIKNHRVSI